MKPIPEVSEWTESVMVPEGGVDARRASSLYPGFMALADRTQYLRKLIMAPDGEGITRIREVASVQELKDLSPQESATGDVVRIAAAIYVFDGAATVPGNDLTIITPTSGSGRWIHTVQPLVGVSNGVASLGSNGKVPDAQLGKGANNGVASLNNQGFVPMSQIPTGPVGGVLARDPSTNSVTTGANGDNAYGLKAIGSAIFTPGAGVIGQGGPGSNVEHSATPGGYGVIAEAGTPGFGGMQRAALRLVPQDNEPSDAQVGDIYYHATANKLRVCVKGSPDAVWEDLN